MGKVKVNKPIIGLHMLVQGPIFNTVTVTRNQMSYSIENLSTVTSIIKFLLSPVFPTMILHVQYYYIDKDGPNTAPLHHPNQ